jgi:hypothetical protein
MKRRNFVASLFLAVTAVMGFTEVVSAGEQVPFKGSLEGTVSITPIVGDPDFDVHVEIDAAGKATHLGDFSVSVPHDVDRRPPPNASFAAGQYLFTAANGDEVHAEFTGDSMLIAPGVLFITETATIIGGTGRFVGATGSFTCERLFDTVAGTTIGSFKGTISSPGADKP